jgi:uncharacterized protein (TIRG00374 family)
MSEGFSVSAQEPDRNRRVGRLAIQAVAGLLVGGTALYFSFSGISLDELGLALRAARWPWIAICGALIWLLFWIRSWRWRLMFPQENAPELRATYRAFIIGALGNATLPGRLGDVARTVILGRRERQIGIMGAFSSLALEKVLDGLVLLALFGGVLLVAPIPKWLQEGALVAGAVFSSAMVILLFLSRARPDRTQCLTRNSRLADVLMSTLDKLRQGLHALGDGKRLLILVILTIFVWVIELMVIAGCLHAMQLDLPATAALLSLVLLSVGTMVPAAPGFVGTYQIALIAALSVYGIEREEALASGLVLNALVIGITIPLGVIAMLGSRDIGGTPNGTRR